MDVGPRLEVLSRSYGPDPLPWGERDAVRWFVVLPGQPQQSKLATGQWQEPTALW